MKLIFSMLNKLKVSCKFLQYTIIIDGHDQAFSISLQYLKKEFRNGVHFLHADKLALSVLTEVARHVQSTQNRKLVIFLQYIKKKMSQLHMFSIVMENIQIFYGGPVMFVATCSVAMLLLSLKQVFWNKSVFYNIITNSKIPK